MTLYEIENLKSNGGNDWLENAEEATDWLITEVKNLRKLSKQLLEGVDKVSGPPVWLVQPFLKIIIDNAETIRRLEVEVQDKSNN